MLFWLTLTASTVWTGGCLSSSTCDTSDQANPVEQYTKGVTVGRLYESGPWHSNYLYYPGGRHYEFIHNLGAAPPYVQVYLSFDENPTGYVSSCVGNTCLIDVNETSVRIKNDTCSDFWVRVVALLGGADTGGTGANDGGSVLGDDADAQVPSSSTPSP